MSAKPCFHQTPDLEAQADILVRRLGGIWSPDGAMCRCPAHDDRTPSLSVRVGERALLFKCFAGCDTLDVIRDPSIGPECPADRPTGPLITRIYA
jgi:hypothetical protein